MPGNSIKHSVLQHNPVSRYLELNPLKSLKKMKFVAVICLVFALISVSLGLKHGKPTDEIDFGT